MNYSEKSNNSLLSSYLNFEKNELMLLQALLTDLLGTKKYQNNFKLYTNKKLFLIMKISISLIPE